MSNAGTQTVVGHIDLGDAPTDMPFVGPFIMIWRGVTDHLDDSGDTTSDLLDVFDQAVAGATSVSETLSGAAKTLAYMDQVQGQVGAPAAWRQVVDQIVRLARDRREPELFVVHISGISDARRREVETTLRRFAHPSITYQTSGAMAPAAYAGTITMTKRS